MQLELIQAFVKVSELGSFSKASLSFGIPKSRLSRQIQQLEAELRVLLLQRSTRSLSLTQEGKIFFEDCQNSIRQLEEAHQKIREFDGEPQGKLRITTAPELGQYLARDLVPRFIQKFPKVILEIESSSEVRDLVKEGFDMAIRPGTIQNEGLVARKLGSAEFILVGNQKFFEIVRALKTVQQIAELPFVLRRPHPGGRKVEIWNEHERITLVPEKIIFETTNFFSARYALINNLGIGYIPKFLVDKDLKDGTLFNLMPNWQSMASDISAILPSRKYVSPKVRSFIDLAVDLIKQGELSF